MDSSLRVARLLLLCSAGCLSLAVAAPAQSVSSVKSVRVRGNRTPVEIEIEGSDRLIPQVKVLTGPDRLVVDFPNTTPSAQMHNQTLNRGDVRTMRVGLYSAKPPITRLVFDLKSPQPYQVFPSGRTVIIKLGSPGAQPASYAPSASGVKLVNGNYPVQFAQIMPPTITPPPPLPLVVTFQNGKLTVSSNKATLSEVLVAIHQRTGAEIAIPAGAEQEIVVAEIGPASAPEVLSHLLNGSKFNFLILSSANDPAMLDRVILSARPEGPAPAYRPLPQMQMQAEDDSENAPPPPAPHPGGNPSPAADQGSPANPGGTPAENAQE